MQRDVESELFGLAGTFPRPGWVVLDAARDHRFTGELRFETSPAARVYLDRGRIYLAERVTDPSLGARLVDAGALTAAQLERGAVRIGPIEHLGHLFERVPNLDRHAVSVTADIMTEECVGWLASQLVPEVVWTPYRHHESGMHRWDRPMRWGEPAPGDPLPAPPPDEAPVSFAPPSTEPDRPSVADVEPYVDGLIEWNEPSWLDGSELADEPLRPRTDQPSGAANDDATTEAVEPSDTPPAHDETDDALGDWIDRLAAEGLPGVDLLTSPKPLPRLRVEPVERFELVWPSGEVDEDFGAVDSVVGSGHDPDADRIGATARLGRSLADVTPHLPASARIEARTTDPASHTASDASAGASGDEPTDEIVLAVRRAVASIEVGSLAARQRLVAGHDDFGAAPADDATPVPAPGRVAVRSGRNDWSRRTVTRSVFDEPTVAPNTAPQPPPAADAPDQRERRSGALRRLIASLRR